MADNKSSICSSLSFKNDKSLNRLLCAWAIQGAFGLILLMFKMTFIYLKQQVISKRINNNLCFLKQS